MCLLRNALSWCHKPTQRLPARLEMLVYSPLKMSILAKIEPGFVLQAYLEDMGSQLITMALQVTLFSIYSIHFFKKVQERVDERFEVVL